MRPHGCAHCHSADLEAELDRYFCFACGGWTDFRGRALPGDAQWPSPVPPAGEGNDPQHGA